MPAWPPIESKPAASQTAAPQFENNKVMFDPEVHLTVPAEGRNVRMGKGRVVKNT